nr:hypothetical protein [Microbacterium barkeri]
MPAFRGVPPSGELRVDHGGAIAVDTAQLREIGRRIAQAAGLYRTTRESLGRASALISAKPAACPQIDVGALRRSRDRLGELGDELENAATGTLVMADAYEVVERRRRPVSSGSCARTSGSARWRTGWWRDGRNDASTDWAISTTSQVCSRRCS